VSPDAPFGSDRPDEEGTGTPEYLGSAPPPGSAGGDQRTAGGSRRWGVVGGVAVGVAAVVAAGTWGALALMSGGAQPAAALPADALGYMSIDLDPSASQKIEAIQTLRKFPALAEQMDVESRDDLRKYFFEKAQEDSTCPDVDYDADIAPWIGNRLGVAGVPGTDGGNPSPVVALQVTDQEAADAGVQALVECTDGGEDVGYAFAGDYVLITDTQENADAFAASAAESSLADDASYQTWMDRLGDPGIVTMYAAPGAMDTLMQLQTDAMMGEMAPEGLDGDAAAEMERMTDQMRKLYADFGGVAGVVRFSDGAVEAEMVTDELPDSMGWGWGTGETPARAGDLPASTGAAFSVSLPDGWLDDYLDLLDSIMGAQMPVDQMVAELEAQSGLAIPEDIEALLGDGVSVALDKEMDFSAAEQDPTAVLAGLRIDGDEKEIMRVVDKIRAAAGPDADMVVTQQGEGVVALGLNADYVGGLAKAGGLGDDATFQDAVAEADRASSVLFVDFDAVLAMVERAGADDQEVVDNLEPLGALGMSSWIEDDGSSRGVLRLTTD
jgi:hypothetical protein